MKRIKIVVLLLSIFASCKGPARTIVNRPALIPSFIQGNFSDDYGIRYNISNTLWIQHPNIKYHIIQWNDKEQYLLAKNADTNPSEVGLFTRIDFMRFESMEPFTWGFCLTVFDAKTKKEAVTKAQADRQNPKKGCSGYPFSRMKKAE